MLEVKSVTKKFDGVVANNDVSFSFEEGQIVGLIGPNGAGKSTMFNMISSIFPPTTGTISFRGESINELPTHQMASIGISRTFQNLQVFKNMTVLENVMIGQHIRSKTGIIGAAFLSPKAKKEETQIYEVAMEQLRFVEMEDFFDHKAGSLSLGKLRLLELARALATDPKLLLLMKSLPGSIIEKH